MASGWSTNVVSVSARPFQYRPIGFLFSSVSLSLSPQLSLSSFSCPPSIVRLRLEGQWGVARAEWNLIWIWLWMDTARLQEIHRLFFGLPWWFLSSSVTGVLPCITKKQVLTGANSSTACYHVGEDALLGDHEEVKWHIWVSTDVPQHQVYHQGNFRLVCLWSCILDGFKKYKNSL